ncbi:hypothetical protein J6590_026256 [Homalodisca vitripennis]|nr:hypothetical protein J6590_026256 [Homalodisca vitripennis]
MNTLLILVLTAIVVHGIEGSQDKNEAGLGVYGGKTVSIKKFPYLVSYLYDGIYIGSGNIVSKSWSLTTAHFIYGFNPKYLTVVAGSDDGATGSQFQAVKIVFHPSFDSKELDYNYACVKVKGHFRWSAKVKPIRLPKSNPQPDTVTKVASWGYIDDKSGRMPFPLHGGEMTLLSQNECSNRLSTFNYSWNERLGCAFNQGKTTLCFGDFGAPFVADSLLYGMFIDVPDYDQSCSSAYPYPVLVSSVAPVVSWIRSVVSHN